MDVFVLAELDRIGDDLAKLAHEFEPDLLSGKQAQRVVCATADIERAALALKTLAMRRVDETGTWRGDGSRTPAKWLANKTGTSMSDAIGTVELGEQLERLPQVSDAARRGQLSPAKTKMVARAASKDPASEELLVRTARHGTMTALRKECAAATLRGNGADAAAKIHAERYFRDWADSDGAYRFEGKLTPDKGARFKKALDGFADQVFHDARKAGIRDSQDQYAADALVAMAEAALAGTEAGQGNDADDDEPGEARAVPKYTKSRVQLILLADATAWTRGYTIAGETCEIAGIGPIDVASAKRMAGDAIVDIVLTHGIDVRTLAHVKHDLTRAQFLALVAQGYECAVDGCGNTRYLEIDHVGDGWALDRKTCIETTEFKCSHCHDLKTYKGWTDGPKLPNGKRKLIPPPHPPPDDG